MTPEPGPGRGATYPGTCRRIWCYRRTSIKSECSIIIAEISSRCRAAAPFCLRFRLREWVKAPVSGPGPGHVAGQDATVSGKHHDDARPSRAAVPGEDPSERGVRESEEVAAPESDPLSELTGPAELVAALREHGVVVDGAAVAVALGVRPPGDDAAVELSVPEWLYQRLAERSEEWREVSLDSGEEQRSVDGHPADFWPRRSESHPVLAHGRYRVTVGWPGLSMLQELRDPVTGKQRRDLASHDELRDRAWRGPSVLVAGLPDVLAWTQERDLPADAIASQWIKDVLLDPRRAPLPEGVLAADIAEVTEILRAVFRKVGSRCQTDSSPIQKPNVPSASSPRGCIPHERSTETHASGGRTIGTGPSNYPDSRVRRSTTTATLRMDFPPSWRTEFF